MPTIVVTDGEERSALATVRSLGRAGHSVHVCSSRAKSLAGSSRYCVSQTRLSNPLHNPERFVSGLAELVERTRADVLVPITEASLLAVLPRRDRFACVIPFPSAQSFERICDKREVLRLAARHGIAVPLQAELVSRADADAVLSGGGLRFPAVIKPSRSVAGLEGERVRAGVAYASTATGLLETVDRVPAAAYPILLQEWIEGPGFAISVLVWNSELIAAFAHRRLREKPPSGGVSVLRESIPLDEELLSRSLALLRDFDWQGVAMVEYKLDARSGIPYLMEINGRLWGSLQLAIDAGVDFPELLIEAALNKAPIPITKYESGVRSRWEWGDVDHLLASLFHSSLSSMVSSPRARRRLSALKDFFLGFSQGNRTEIFRTDDPAPFVRETVDWFRRR